MGKRLSKKQIGFAKDYVETGNGTQSILRNYDTKNPRVASVMAVENLAKPSVQALIEDYAEKAAKNVQLLAETAENETVRLNANRDVLDRAGYKAVEKTVNVNVELSASPEIQELTKKLNELYRGASGSSDGGKPRAVGDQA